MGGERSGDARANNGYDGPEKPGGDGTTGTGVDAGEFRLECRGPTHGRGVPNVVDGAITRAGGIFAEMGGRDRASDDQPGRLRMKSATSARRVSKKPRNSAGVFVSSMAVRMARIQASRIAISTGTCA